MHILIKQYGYLVFMLWKHQDALPLTKRLRTHILHTNHLFSKQEQAELLIYDLLLLHQIAMWRDCAHQHEGCIASLEQLATAHYNGGS